MELRQLRYFVAVAEERNFGAAARRLNVSQPPITRQIRQLEQELDVALFRRTYKGVELTASGDVFLEDARRILSQSRRATERSQAAQRGDLGELEVAFFGSPIYSQVPGLLRRYRAEYPDVSVQLQRLGKPQQIDALRDGRIHVGFGRYYPFEPDIVVETITREPILWAVRSDDAPAGDQPVSLRDMQEQPIILFPSAGRPSFADEVVALFKQAGCQPHVVHEAEDVTSALALTAIGMGACLVPQSVAVLSWPGLSFVKLADPEPTCPVDCVYRRGETSPLLRAFLASVRTYFDTGLADSN
jgi:DNA-binding transcriptional LysR family regulator